MGGLAGRITGADEVGRCAVGEFASECTACYQKLERKYHTCSSNHRTVVIKKLCAKCTNKDCRRFLRMHSFVDASVHNPSVLTPDDSKKRETGANMTRQQRRRQCDNMSLFPFFSFFPVTELYPSLDIERQLYRPALAPGFVSSRNNSLTASAGGGSLSSGENGGAGGGGGGASSRRTSGYSGQFIAGNCVE